MTGVDDIPDEILGNILFRLPAKPMAGRCRCVSKHWNHLISDPNFMMSRSPMIFLSRRSSISYILDASTMESVTNVDISMFKLPRGIDRFVTTVGTFRGIILLVVSGPSFHDELMLLYNPFTGVYDKLDDPYRSVGFTHPRAYGFGHGATNQDELKIVRFRYHSWKKNWTNCEVFNLKTRSWSQPLLKIDQDTRFKKLIGTFLKGYLYWIMDSLKIMALNVDTMEVSYILLPDKSVYLGTRHGCLWMISNTAINPTLNYDVWVMNDEHSWSKACSMYIAIGLKPQSFIVYQIIEITEDGKIIIFVNDDGYGHMIIYDTSKHSYKLVNSQLAKRISYVERSGIEYKESLISPMDICRV